MDPRRVFWKKVFPLPGTQWTLSGYSRSAYRTGFYVGGLDIMLDGGPQSFQTPDHIFITHTHGDHIAELPFTMIKDTNDMSNKITVYCPDVAEKHVRDYIMQLHNTNSMSDTSAIAHLYYNLVPIPQDRTLKRVIIKKQPMLLETVGADHSIPTVVYGLSVIKSKLNPIYQGLSGAEIGALRKNGTNVSIEVTEKKFCYVLDTSIKVFEYHPFLLEYPIIIVECTFIFDDEIEHANDKKHIHWQHLKPYVEQNSDKLFILTHFSMRYKDLEIKEFFAAVTASGITNIYPWLTDTERST